MRRAPKGIASFIFLYLVLTCKFTTKRAHDKIKTFIKCENDINTKVDIMRCCRIKRLSVIEKQRLISQQLHLAEQGVENTLALLDLGCTIPFIARYRKERTGNLNEVQIAQISESYDKLKEIGKRKETILKTISEQGKLTDELKKRIEDCWDATTLEDLYLPFKPKRRTRAQVAREQGLEPLATLLLLQREPNPERAAQRFVKGDVTDEEMAIKGA